MATEQMGFNIGTEVAAADLSAKQFFAMKYTSSGVNIATAAGEPILGILQNKPVSGAVADVCTLGVCKAVAGAAITKGAKLMTDANGRVITAATTGSTIIGWALEAAGASGDIITIALNPATGVV